MKGGYGALSSCGFRPVIPAACVLQPTVPTDALAQKNHSIGEILLVVKGCSFRLARLVRQSHERPAELIERAIAGRLAILRANQRTRKFLGCGRE